MASLLVFTFIIFIQNCIAQKSPTITYIEPNQIRTVGTRVNLKCSVKDLGDHSVVWRKSDNVTLSMGRTMISHHNRFSIRHRPRHRHNASVSTYTLNIQRIRKSDGGIYYCEVPGFPQVSAPVELEVRWPPVFLNNSTQSTITAQEGEDVRLECYADGNPTPTITWKHVNKETGREGDVIHQGNVLLIESIRKEDRGTYNCGADNKVRRGNWPEWWNSTQWRTVEVMVPFAPEITVLDPIVSQALGYERVLSCKVDGYPLPTVIWLKNDVPLSFESQHHKIFTFSVVTENADSKLTIHSVEKSDYGKYVCRATNKLGSAKGEVELLESKEPVYTPLGFMLGDPIL